MRGVLPRLFIVQFLSWAGMFCLWINALPVMAHLWRVADPAMDAATATQRGLVTIGAGFALYALLGAALAFAVPWVVARLGVRLTYGLGLLIGGAGVAALGLASGPAGVILPFIAIGIGWAAMANLPYAIAGAAAPEGRGAHQLRLFGFSTVLPQAVVTLAIAIAFPSLAGSGTIMLAGGALMAAGGLAALTLGRDFTLADEDW